MQMAATRRLKICKIISGFEANSFKELVRPQRKAGQGGAERDLRGEEGDHVQKRHHGVRGLHEGVDDDDDDDAAVEKLVRTRICFQFLNEASASALGS